MSPASRAVIPNWLPAWPGKIQPFKDHLSTHGHQTGLRNEPGCRQIVEPLAVVCTHLLLIAFILSFSSNSGLIPVDCRYPSRDSETGLVTS